jgi:ribonuclease I
LEKLNPIIDELKLKWYSTETSDEYFWSHEWEKHGSCMFTEIDELEYFQNALDLYNYVETNDIIKDYLEDNPLKCQIPFDSEFNLIEYY